MKYIFLLLFGNIMFLSFSQGNDIAVMLWGNYDKPEMIELNFNPPIIRTQRIQYDGEIIINCGDGIEIFIHPSENKRDNLVEVKKDGEILYEFFSLSGLNHFYLEGAYKINLFPNNHNTVLLVTYPVGASGLAANMTWGILFDIDKRSYQFFSTWGMVHKHFIDINGDGIFEFVSVDYDVGYYLGMDIGRMLVANVFKPDVLGQYSINISAETDDVFIFLFDDRSIKKMKWKQSKIRLLKSPDVFREENYITEP